jgi:hypothetical protein
MKPPFPFLAVIVLLLPACASLTKSQVSAVNQFAQTSANFSAFPSKIITGLHDVHVRHQLYAANSLASGNAHVEGIKDAYDFKVRSSALPEKMNISFRIIDKYANPCCC